jgi:hypothetical protein
MMNTRVNGLTQSTNLASFKSSPISAQVLDYICCAGYAINLYAMLIYCLVDRFNNVLIRSGQLTLMDLCINRLV